MSLSRETSFTPETLWAPRRPGKLLCLPFLADGKTKAGLYALHHEKKLKSLAVVLETNTTNVAEPGDIVLIREGFSEELTTSEGDFFWLVDETAVITILDNLTLDEPNAKT